VRVCVCVCVCVYISERSLIFRQKDILHSDILQSKLNRNSVCLSIYLSVCVVMCLPLYLSVCASITISVSVSVFVSVSVSAFVCVCGRGCEDEFRWFDTNGDGVISSVEYFDSQERLNGATNRGHVAPPKVVCVAVCCTVLHCVALCCTVLHCVALCCRVSHCVAVCYQRPRRAAQCCLCCGVLHCVNEGHVVPTRLSVLQYVVYVAVCCSVLQCAAVCCSVLRCVTKVFSRLYMRWYRDDNDWEAPKNITSLVQTSPVQIGLFCGRDLEI